MYVILYLKVCCGSMFCPFHLAVNTIFQQYKYYFSLFRSVSKGLKMHFMLETHLTFTFFVIFNSFPLLSANPSFHLFFYLFGRGWGGEFALLCTAVVVT